MNQSNSVLFDLLKELVPRLLEPGANSNKVLENSMPDLVKAASDFQVKKDLESRANYVASLACGFLHTTLETSEDDDTVRSQARRAVRLADYVLHESERFHGVGKK